MRFRSGLWCAAVAVAVLGSGAHGALAQPVVDQSQLAGNIYWAIGTGEDIGQTFTVGVSGILAGVEVSLGNGASATTSLTFEVLTTSGGVPQASPALASVTIPASSLPGFGPTALVLGSVTGTYVDLSSANIAVTAGQVLAFRLSTDDTNYFNIRGNGGTGTSYAGGSRFTNYSLQGDDLTFKTFVTEMASVPAVSHWGVALFILALGVLGLFIARRVG